MAAKKSSKKATTVEEAVVETTNKGVETTTEATVAEPTETKASEEDYVEDGASVEVGSLADVETESSDEAEYEKASEEPEESKPSLKTKTRLFDKREAKRFSITEDGMIKATLYKHCIFTFRFEGDYYSDDLYNPIKASFVGRLKSLIHSLNVPDIEYRDMDYNRNAVNEYGKYHMFGVLVPYTARTGVIMDTLINFVKEENQMVDDSIPPEYQVVKNITIRNSVVVDIDAAKGDKDSFMKSLVIASSVDKNNSVADIRSALFIDPRTGWEDEDVRNMNKYIMANTKLNLYATSEEEKEKFISDFTYRVGMRSRVNFVLTEFNSVNDDGTFGVTRKLITMSIFIKEMFNKTVPIGIHVKTTSEDIDIKSSLDILKSVDEDGKDTDVLSTLTRIPADAVSFKTLHSDFESLDKHVLSAMTTESAE